MVAIIITSGSSLALFPGPLPALPARLLRLRSGKFAPPAAESVAIVEAAEGEDLLELSFDGTGGAFGDSGAFGVEMALPARPQRCCRGWCQMHRRGFHTFFYWRNIP